MITRRQIVGAATVGAAAVAASRGISQTSPDGEGDSERQHYRVIGLEEHVVLPEMQTAWKTQPDFRELPIFGYGDSPLARRILDTGEERLADMEDQGVDMQVLSAPTPGVTTLAIDVAIAAAQEINDALHVVVASNPTRFQAFATLATQSPEAAAKELERCVTQLGFCGAMIYGRDGEKKLDDPSFDVLYAAAERLGVPLHLHPKVIPQTVNEAYYTGINGTLDFEFGGPGIGWYYDLGVQVLRMVLSGTFDRFPNLQLILGHWGETVLFYLDHAQYLQERVELQRPFMDYFRQNMWVAGSGTQSDRYLRWAAEVVGTDRMLFSTDYPITFDSGFKIIETSKNEARALLERSDFSTEEQSAIGAGNWQRLIGGVTDAFK